jgi:AraC-like DNA-binding protein
MAIKLKRLFLQSKHLVMRFQIIKPTGKLAQYIKYYWVMEKSSLEGDVCERVIPTGNIDIMFHYKNCFKVRSSDNNFYKQEYSFISGISNSYADVTTNGETGLICVTFYPFGACSFFNFPLLEIENQNIRLDCIFGNESKEVFERLCTAQFLNDRIAIIENFLLAKLNESATRDSLLLKSGIEFINQSKGQISAAKLSEKLCITPKTLERKFSAMLGKSPKQFIKIVRFQNILNTYSNANGKSLTQLAYLNGYFDQSHFIKDFKTFSGYTPKDFFENHQCQSDYFS